MITASFFLDTNISVDLCKFCSSSRQLTKNNFKILKQSVVLPKTTKKEGNHTKYIAKSNNMLLCSIVSELSQLKLRK